jgi:solute carrier family 35 protein C2
MFVSLFIIAIPVETFPALFHGIGLLIDEKGPILGPALLLFPGIIAFCMTASEFALLQRTSVVTLSIAGIFKEVVTISAAGLLFHDKLTIINFAGLFVTIGAIAAYNWVKIKKMRETAMLEAHKHHLVGTGDSDGDDEEEEEDEEGDWNVDGRAYVTSDGDIMPAFHKKGEGKKKKKRQEGEQMNGAAEAAGL